MIIALPDGSRLTISTKSDSAGGALTHTPCCGTPTPVAFGQQLRTLLRSLGDDHARVHMERLRAWCSIALDRDSRHGHKANNRNRQNWERSARLLDVAMIEDEQPTTVREEPKR